MPDVHVCAKKRRRASLKPKQEPQSWATWFATHKPKDGTVCQSLRGLEKFISQVYFDKIVADEVDDRENKSREVMPQFVFEMILNKSNLQEAWLSFRTLGSSLERAVRKYCLGDAGSDFEGRVESPSDEEKHAESRRGRRASIFGMQEGVKQLERTKSKMDNQADNLLDGAM